MKKRFIFLFIIFICISIFVLKDDVINLSKDGYKVSEIILIKTRTNKEQLKYFLNNNFKNIDELFNDENYKKENLIFYLEVKNIITDESFKDIIVMVNKYQEDITYLQDLVKENNFKINNIDNYMDLYYKDKNKSTKYVINTINDGNSDEYNPIINEIIKEAYYIEKNKSRYINYYNKNKDMKTKDIVANVNANLDYDYYTNIKTVDLSYDNLILVNKYYQLDSSFIPSNLVSISSTYGYAGKMDKDAYNAYQTMYEAAKNENLTINMVSPYRSYELQTNLYNKYVRENGQTSADTFSARAGHSEHQTGLAIDVCELEERFENTKEFKWLNENAHKYGFILRYPKGKEHLTGYMYEPWHYRYLGVDTATKVKTSGLTYDEYFAYYIEKK